MLKDLRHECGVFGVYAPGKDVAEMAYLALYSLQHRGQESCGIAVSDGSNVLLAKDMGLVGEVFDETTLSSLKGDISIGHVRYSTCGSTYLVNAQPILVHYSRGSLALGHNGNLINMNSLRDELEAKGALFQSTSDSELIAHIVAKSSQKKIENAIKETMKRIVGAYSIVVMTEDRLIGAVDPNGFRPLVIGKLPDGGHAIASETCALDVIGAEFVRDMKPGEIVVVDKNGMRSENGLSSKRAANCVFEHIYFSRPDSVIRSQSVQDARKKMGEFLYEQKKTKADVVVPVPDSGIYAAIGYSNSSGLPYEEGLLKNKYIGRTFIQPHQRERNNSVKIKLNPIPSVLKGKRIILVDDSIVRGTTVQHIVSLVRSAGAKEVHLRITSPPIKWPCYYGIDTPERENLIAASKSVTDIAKFLGADSLEYLTLENLVTAVGIPKKELCMACLDGNYPLKIQDSVGKFVLEENNGGKKTGETCGVKIGGKSK